MTHPKFRNDCDADYRLNGWNVFMDNAGEWVVADVTDEGDWLEDAFFATEREAREFATAAPPLRVAERTPGKVIRAFSAASRRVP